MKIKGTNYTLLGRGSKETARRIEYNFDEDPRYMKYDTLSVISNALKQTENRAGLFPDIRGIHTAIRYIHRYSPELDPRSRAYNRKIGMAVQHIATRFDAGHEELKRRYQFADNPKLVEVKFSPKEFDSVGLLLNSLRWVVASRDDIQGMIQKYNGDNLKSRDEVKEWIEQTLRRPSHFPEGRSLLPEQKFYQELIATLPETFTESTLSMDTYQFTVAHQSAEFVLVNLDAVAGSKPKGG